MPSGQKPLPTQKIRYHLKMVSDFSFAFLGRHWLLVILRD